jgi:hypothetical protein
MTTESYYQQKAKNDALMGKKPEPPKDYRNNDTYKGTYNHFDKNKK